MAGASACAMAALLTAVPASAAAPKVRFQIAPKPYSDALIDVAIQADISLLGASSCPGYAARGLKGDYTVEEALRRLLADAPCTWRLVAPRAVQIIANPPVAAAEAPVKAADVDEVLVTATKRVQSIYRLAAAVSVISRKQLAATRSVDPGDTSGQLAGVQTTNLGPGRDKLLLRGLSDGAFTGRARSTVGTYLDDIPINYNAPDPDLRLVDVARVEVVRGPQGALYGSGALSGVYRIVTHKPDLDRYSAGAGASYATTEGGAPSWAVEGYANLPVLSGHGGVRVAAYDEVDGGYLDDLNLQRSNVDKTVRRGGRVSFSYQPNSNWSFDLSTTAQHLRSDDTHYTTPSRALIRANGIAEGHANDISFVSATVRGGFGWGDMVSSTGYVRHAYSSIYDATATAGAFTLNASSLGAYFEATRAKMLVQDLVFTSRGGRRFGWLAGLYATDMLEDSPSRLAAGRDERTLVTVYRENREDRIREIAAYGEASYEFAPRWTVAVGARVFQNRVQTSSDVKSERFSPRSFVRKARTAGISPKITLQHEFDDGDLFYAVISDGYRAAGINSGGGNPLAASRETFGSDHLRNYELGVKVRAWDNRLVARGALFYDSWTNIQTDQFRPSGIPYTTNVGDAGTLGLEAELSYAWDFGLSLQSNIFLARTQTTDANPDYAPKLANGLPGVPDAAVGLLATYERPLFGDASMRLVAEANYVGRSRITFNPNLARGMGGYTKARFAAEFFRPAWSAQVYVTNPFNSTSDTFAFGNPFTFGQVRQTTPQRPRTLGIALAAAF